MDLTTINAKRSVKKQNISFVNHRPSGKHIVRYTKHGIGEIDLDYRRNTITFRTFYAGKMYSRIYKPSKPNYSINFNQTVLLFSDFKLHWHLGRFLKDIKLERVKT